MSNRRRAKYFSAQFALNNLEIRYMNENENLMASFVMVSLLSTLMVGGLVAVVIVS